MQDKETIRIEVTTKEVLKVVGIAVGCFVGYKLLGRMQKPLSLIVIAFFLAIALNPPVSRLAKILPNKSRGIGTAIAYLFVIGILGLFINLTVPPIAKQGSSLATKIPSYVEDIRESRGPIGNWIDKNNLQPQIIKASDSISKKLGDLGDNLFSSASTVVGILSDIVAVLVLTFLMLIEGPGIMRRFWSRYKNKEMREKHEELANKMYKIITAYFNGQVLVAGINSLCAFAAINLVSLIFGKQIPFSFALAACVFIFGLIPMIGNILGASVVVIVAAFVNWQAALVLAIYFFVYQQIENATIQPAINGKTLSMSPLMILIVMLTSVSVGGILAAFIALPVAGCTQVIVDYKLHIRRLMGKENNYFRLGRAK